MTEEYGRYTFDYDDSDSCSDCGSNRSVSVIDNELKRDLGSFCANCNAEEIYNMKNFPDEEDDEYEDEEEHEDEEEYDEEDEE
ncbi:hypothetical protein PaeCFBP13512_12845 [Paenibacillus sp. CFBP13512]|uniref:hypothetical protein n=1 Tax=Paenibacillus sp. CFBP13512 TaxID=2184007 RepID=UPI0010BFAD5F|nr:hypothetical protein [Paenibacillus sp. CFBP13512]TKJ90712.1 hypothetical protein PaeCFBP13512_12845 [Paenibacillus sp. CFBP13512]